MKWNRESFLVTLVGVALLFAIFYYGKTYLIEPVKSEANVVSGQVATQETIAENYPPSEEGLVTYQEAHTTAQAYLPQNERADTALVALTNLADSTNVQISGLTRITNQETVEYLPENFAKSNYVANLTTDSPANFQQLMNALMEEERVFDVTSFSFENTGGNAYVASLGFDLFYHSDQPIEESEEAIENTADAEGTSDVE